MSKSPPERVTISIPEDDPLDIDTLDRLVEESDHESRSDFVRAAIRGETDIDPDDFLKSL